MHVIIERDNDIQRPLIVFRTQLLNSLKKKIVSSK